MALVGKRPVRATDPHPTGRSTSSASRSCNAFGILGLRSLYFLLAGAVDRFRYLKPGLAALLIFAGLKILLADIIPISIPLSLAIIVTILATAIGASLVADRRDQRRRVAQATAHPEETHEEVTPSTG